MEMVCAGCGCVVDSGVVVRRCGNAKCCCKDLPVKNAHPNVMQHGFGSVA